MKKRSLFLVVFLIVAILLLSLFLLGLKSHSIELGSSNWLNPIELLREYFTFVKTSPPPVDQLSVPVEGEGGGVIMESTTGLEENQVYVKNGNSFRIINHLVSVPISFEPCEYTEGQNNVRLQEDVPNGAILTAQIQPTGYYQKDSASCTKGSVMFAVAHVQVTLDPGEEKIYNIIRSNSNPGSFTYAPEVSSFLTSGQLIS